MSGGRVAHDQAERLAAKLESLTRAYEFILHATDNEAYQIWSLAPQALNLAAVLVARVQQLEAIEQAARDFLTDDDIPNHWDDCVCSYCVRYRTLRNALAGGAS